MDQDRLSRKGIVPTRGQSVYMSALVLAVALPLTVDVERLFMLLKPNAQIYDGWLLLVRGNIVCTKPDNLEAVWSRNFTRPLCCL
jgi:hypothetical protein